MKFNWFKKQKKIDFVKFNRNKPKEEEKIFDEKQNSLDFEGEKDASFSSVRHSNDSSSVEEMCPKDTLDLHWKDQDDRSNNNSNIEKKGIFAKLKKGLSKTRKIFSSDIDSLFRSNDYLDDNVLESLEELLITSDVGVDVTMDLIREVSLEKSNILGAGDLKKVLKEKILGYFDVIETTQNLHPSPLVIMVVGVNGVGKTTTIGKLAAMELSKGRTTLLVAADTFRAAATEQLSVYADRLGIDIIKQKPNADPSAVAYDGVSAAISRGIDTVFIDTAGRLHTKVNLMKELEKISKVISRKVSDAPHEVLLVLDATNGQNSVSQTEEFNKSLNLTGLALTKLDGSAKGGIIINISNKFNIPIKYIGLGEKVKDIERFNPEIFVDAMI